MKYEEIRVKSGKATKNVAANECAFQLMKATFQLGNLMGEVAPPSPSLRAPPSPTLRTPSSLPQSPTTLAPPSPSKMATLSPPSPRRRLPSFGNLGRRRPSVTRSESSHPQTPTSPSPSPSGLLVPHVLVRRFSSPAGSAGDVGAGGRDSGPQTPSSPSWCRSVVGDLIESIAVPFFGAARERKQRSRQSSAGDEVMHPDNDLWDGHDLNVSAGCEYLDVTGRYLMNLWRHEKVVSASEDEVQHALYGSNTDDEFIPDLVGESEIFDIKLRKHLIRVIPARCQGYPWKLGFSTSRDGFSLANLYRKMESIDSCVLLVIQDTSHNVFGALLSDAPALNDHFYGTGESFLFTFTEPPAKSEDAADGADASKSPANGNSPSISIQDEGIDVGAVDQASDCGTVEPAVEADSDKEASGEQDQIRVRQKNASGNSDQADVSDDTDKKSEGGNSDQPKSILLPVSNKSSGNHFRVFKWSGENSFFIRCHPDSLAVGAGDGHFGLLLDGDLNHGRTDVCTTFRNDILTKNNDFIILTVECWCFD